MTKVYIVLQLVNGTIVTVESVWSTFELAQAALNYCIANYKNSNYNNYYIIERELDPKRLK